MTIHLEPEQSVDAELSELLLLRHGGEYFALPLAAAMEAMEVPVLARLPDAPASLLGMLTDRGAAIPVFAASRILEVEGSGAGDDVLLIVRDGDARVALVVDEIEDVIMADLSTVQQPMDSMRGDGVVRGVVRSGSRLIALLDARAVVRMGTRALPELA